MNEHFELTKPETDGVPLLYSHGLGSPDLMAEQLRIPVQELGFAIWNLTRDDQALLNGDAPETELIDGVIEAAKKIQQQTSQKVHLAGTSLGSHPSIMAASKTNDLIKSVLGTDAFLEPAHGFKTIEDWGKADAQHVNASDLSELKSDNDKAFKEKLATCPPGSLPCPLIHNRWITLPNGLEQKFTNISLAVGTTINTPVHLIWGGKDPFVRDTAPPTDLIPNASSYIINGGDHNKWMQYPAAVKSAVDFLQRQIATD